MRTGSGGRCAERSLVLWCLCSGLGAGFGASHHSPQDPEAGEAGPTRLNLLRQALLAPSSLPVSLPAESVPVVGRRI